MGGVTRGRGCGDLSPLPAASLAPLHLPALLCSRAAASHSVCTGHCPAVSLSICLRLEVLLRPHSRCPRGLVRLCTGSATIRIAGQTRGDKLHAHYEFKRTGRHRWQRQAATRTSAPLLVLPPEARSPPLAPRHPLFAPKPVPLTPRALKRRAPLVLTLLLVVPCLPVLAHRRRARCTLTRPGRARHDGHHGARAAELVEDGRRGRLARVWGGLIGGLGARGREAERVEVRRRDWAPSSGQRRVSRWQQRVPVLTQTK